jgi:hypothetical protein
MLAELEASGAVNSKYFPTFLRKMIDPELTCLVEGNGRFVYRVQIGAIQAKKRKKPARFNLKEEPKDSHIK